MARALPPPPLPLSTHLHSICITVCSARAVGGGHRCVRRRAKSRQSQCTSLSLHSPFSVSLFTYLVPLPLCARTSFDGRTDGLDAIEFKARSDAVLSNLPCDARPGIRRCPTSAETRDRRPGLDRYPSTAGSDFSSRATRRAPRSVMNMERQNFWQMSRGTTRRTGLCAARANRVCKWAPASGRTGGSTCSPSRLATCRIEAAIASGPIERDR